MLGVGAGPQHPCPGQRVYSIRGPNRMCNCKPMCTPWVADVYSVPPGGTHTQTRTRVNARGKTAGRFTFRDYVQLCGNVCVAASRV